jgi:hypothetical protein
VKSISIKIDVSKIDKEELYKGSKGTYLDLLLRTNKDGPSQYGDDGFVCQSVSKESRLAGKKGPIIGNWRHIELGQGNGKPAPAAEQEADSDIPF